MKRMRVGDLRKREGQTGALVALTAYDYTFARLAEAAGVDILLVGDSLAHPIQGEETTLPVTLEQMIYHARCVARACEGALLVVDLPFRAYKASPAQAFDSAARLMAEGGAEVVKLEGGGPMVETVGFLHQRGIPVIGHLGLTPQSVHQLGGYRVQGRSAKAVEGLVVMAQELEQAGAQALVLEAVPYGVGRRVTEALSIPVIGIGAGADCDGQVLVLHDVLGLGETAPPRFAKCFLDGAGEVKAALTAFCQEVRAGTFPSADYRFD